MSNDETALSGRSYVATLLVLVALTLTSWGLSYVPLGAFSPAVGLGIGFIKAVIVALFFMQLYRAPFVLKLVIVVTVLFILLLTFGMVADVALR